MTEGFFERGKRIAMWADNQSSWQGLSDVELSLLAEKYTGADGLDVVDYGRAIEQALKDKNT